jgi:DNA polymerase-1
MGLTVKNQKKTATGARSTKESELEKMRELHPIIGDVLSYRELQKLLSTYIDVIPTLLDGNDRLHTTYVQEGSTTGRLASLNPNLQNIPIKTELGRAIRHAFVADQGWELLSFDYSQIELRIAAFLSKDPTMVDIFKNGRDVHTEVATRVFHVAAEEVTREQRRRAKVINFGILYGMGVNALRESLGTNRAEAQEFYNQYFEAFPRLAEYLEETKADAARLGYTETYFGRRRYFVGIGSSIPFVRAAAERMAINAPIQGTSADLIKLAMVEIAQWIQKEKLGSSVRMLLQVHDELVFEIQKGSAKTYAPHVKDIMEGVIAQKDSLGIPFKAEGKVGTNWGDMQELGL